MSSEGRKEGEGETQRGRAKRRKGEGVKLKKTGGRRERTRMGEGGASGTAPSWLAYGHSIKPIVSICHSLPHPNIYVEVLTLSTLERGYIWR